MPQPTVRVSVTASLPEATIRTLQAIGRLTDGPPDEALREEMWAVIGTHLLDLREEASQYDR